MRRVVVPANLAVSPNDTDALVAEAVAAIQGGQVVVLPTETVYGLAADPRSVESIERIRTWKGRAEELHFTHHLADATDLAQFVEHVPPRVRALIDRYWPGPLTIVLPVPTGTSIGVRLPGHAFTRAVARALGGSLFLTSVNATGEAPFVGPDEIAAAVGDRIDLLFDGGAPPLRQASTVVRWRPVPQGEDFGELEVLREGVLTAAELTATAARTIWFICTGNTCRSPIAELIARREAARRLATTDDRVSAHGLIFASAGITALPGMPASEGSLQAMREVGMSLDSHASRVLSRELLTSADRVYCLGPSHLVAVRAMLPELGERAELLDPRGAGIPDPYGHGLDTYRATREAIQRAVCSRLDELLPR